jgi:hypothetical protein
VTRWVAVHSLCGCRILPQRSHPDSEFRAFQQSAFLVLDQQLHPHHSQEMRFVTLAVVLLFSAIFQCYASPMLPVDTITPADLLSNTKENFQHFAKVFALVEDATMDALQKHAPALASVRSNRKLQQDPSKMTCPGAATSQCTSTPSSSLAACFSAFSKSGRNFNPMSGPFSFASLLCMSPTCTDILISFFKTCSCVDFQPMVNIACPNSPKATACSRNTAVQSFVAWNADPAAGLFGLDVYVSLLTLMPQPYSWKPDFKPCGDPKLYRRTVLINSLGVCLDELVAAFPMPTYMTDARMPEPYKSLTFGQVMTSSMKCAITFPSFLYQAMCSGTVGKCYSASQLSAVSDCKNMTASFCPANCKQQLASAGAPDSTFPAKCCVKWFQEQAAAPKCSDTPTISLAQLMGQDCINNQKLFLSATGADTSMIESMYSMAMFPAPCASKSPASQAVANCAVTSSLEAACPNDAATPFVQSSVFAPKKVSTVTVTFSSSTLKAVRAICFISCLKSFRFNFCVCFKPFRQTCECPVLLAGSRGQVSSDAQGHPKRP